MLISKYHPYKRQGGQAARCACCVRSTPAGSTGWVEIHVEGEAAFYRSGCSHTAIGQVTAMMSEVIRACSNLVPQQEPCGSADQQQAPVTSTLSAWSAHQPPVGAGSATGHATVSHHQTEGGMLTARQSAAAHGLRHVWQEGRPAHR
ncbi:hypothetical protein HaLaN_11069 [Haematococcus lacustris]|uniref:Uncharacterized protein n=1 Tax=Haematococcus lacustris TaxID=44745 RepID=A0A699Z6P1_HAELA|nr:hypothetical protein HaLaN_11069 [Haematococcus lacustris]